MEHWQEEESPNKAKSRYKNNTKKVGFLVVINVEPTNKPNLTLSNPLQTNLPLSNPLQTNLIFLFLQNLENTLSVYKGVLNVKLVLSVVTL